MFGNDRITVLAFFFHVESFYWREGSKGRAKGSTEQPASWEGGQRELERVISVTAGRQWTPPAFSATKVAFTEISVYHFHFTKTQWY